MTRLESPDLDPELTLELARLATEPRAGDKLRNFTALSGRLGLPVTRPFAAGSDSGGGVAQPRELRGAVLGSAPWRQLVAVGIATGAMGFLLGLHFEVPHSENQPFRVQAVPAASLAAPELEAANAEPLGMQPGESTESSEVPARVLSPARHAASPTPSEAAQSPSVKQARPARHGRSGDTSAARTPNTRPSAAFLEAVQLLGRARRALDRGEPTLALGLLDDIDRRFPPDLLDEERAATRVLGLCASGESEAAVQLATRVFSGRPRSIYTRRIERSCASAALVAPSAPERER
jgi:hypothetical protein